MSTEREIFAVIWLDAVGPLALIEPDAQSAINKAQSIRDRGADKVRCVRAVHVAAGATALRDLEGN